MLASHIALGDIFKITSGGTPSRREPAYFEGGNIPWVKTGDLKGKYITDTEEKITELAVLNSSAKVFPAGTVLLAMYGATIGACSILKTEAATNQACAAFLPASNVDSEYLYYYLRSQKDSFARDGVGGAQPNISGAYLKRVTIPLPPLETQKHIVRVLEQADQLRKQAQQMESELNQLAQSLFLDMFGDPLTNPNNWKVIQLGKLIVAGDKINYGVVQPGEDVDDGVPLVRVSDLSENMDSLEGLKRIQHDIESQYSRSRLVGDEILIGCVGSIGRVGLVTSSLKGANIARAVARIRPSNAVLRSFLYFYLQTPFVQGYFLSETRTVSQPTLNIGLIEKTHVLVPPIEKQRGFEDAMDKINKQMKNQRDRIVALETLFQSLMQRAFKGELTPKANTKAA